MEYVMNALINMDYDEFKYNEAFYAIWVLMIQCLRKFIQIHIGTLKKKCSCKVKIIFIYKLSLHEDDK